MTKFESIRRLLGLSQAEVAVVVGKTQSNISMYEKRRQKVPVPVAQRLLAHAASLGVNLTLDEFYSTETV
jgi:putative transcriptional regulator